MYSLSGREVKRLDIVKTENLSFDYIRRDEEGNVDGIVNAVKNMNLSISQGDFVAVLGHNGSGKSTFAKHLNSLLVPTEGTVWIDGMDTTDEDKLWDIRQSVGMVFQNPDNQIIGSIVEEDVGFGPENMGVPTEQIWERVRFALEAVGMTEFSKASPNRLSGGQKQRIAIAGIVAMKPKCIVLDEPTAMLDPNGRREVIKTLHDLNNKENVTVILITHYMDEVVGADRVIVMDDGTVVMDGTPKEVFSHVEELKKLRLDVPQVTQVAYELQKQGISIPDGIIDIEEFVEIICQLSQIK
jgi:energy-coupling factor transporter ATPase